MAEAVIKHYELKSEELYDRFEFDDCKLSEIGLTYIITKHGMIPKGWVSCFHHDAGTTIDVRRGPEGGALSITGLKDSIEDTKTTLESEFGKLKEIHYPHIETVRF